MPPREIGGGDLGEVVAVEEGGDADGAGRSLVLVAGAGGAASAFAVRQSDHGQGAPLPAPLARVEQAPPAHVSVRVR